VITLSNLTLRRGAKVVLERATATLNPGEKIGLVGRNGAGKSSLFALLTGDLQPDAGDVLMPPRWKEPGGMATVAQHMPETADSATTFVVEGDGRLMAAQAALAAAETAFEAQPDDVALGEALAHAHQAVADAGGFDAKARAQSLILGLGFKPDELERPVNSFSGGWRMRLQLARALMAPSDLLLLDEPTNHLDLDALVWLEAWLKRYPGTLLVISHDREFLDAVTQVTLHVERATLTRYGANYSGFEELRAERLRLQQAAFARQQEHIAHLQKFITRFKAKATKAKQAQSRVKALERMERVAPVLAEADFHFEFREPKNVPNPMLAMQGLDCGYQVDGTPKPIVHRVSRSVMAGQRIGVLGANGQGKSTLVKTIAAALPPLTGTLTPGKDLNIGYFAQQELDVLAEDDTPLQHMTRWAKRIGHDAREQDLRTFLGSFRFVDDMVHQRVGTMSGGEKARLVLATLVWQRPNLLLLDEPTNHLDLATREALSMALNSFDGALLLVSHDRALLREVCDEFWLVADGQLKPFDGDLDDYQQWLKDRERERDKIKASPSPSAATTAPIPGGQGAAAHQAPARPVEPDRRAAAAERQRLADLRKPHLAQQKRLETKMAPLQARKTELDGILANPATYEPGSTADVAALQTELADLNYRLAELEAAWLEAEEAINATT
jgi:ATP-binding cassette subfamily F protein 3